jgi:pimeloyl-ACP methyl ester carboxylesterase
MKRSLFLFVPLLMAAGCSSSSSDNSLRPKAQQKEVSCEEFRRKLPAGYVSQFIDVPEESGNPASPHIKIFYYYKSPLKGRVTLFLNGGPGGSSHSSFALMEDAIHDFGIADQMTFIYMDQRGTGCSSDYPSADTDDQMFERGKWYGTRGIVGDAEQIRRAVVGDHPWSIFGQSYGAMIAHRYAVLAPGSLDRVVAYANTITPDHFMRARDRMVSQIDVWNSYFAAYPADRMKVATLKQYLSLQVCVPVLNEPTCGLELVSPLAGSYLGFHDTWSRMHTWLSRLVVDGFVKIDELTRFADNFAEQSSVAEKRSIAAINYYDRDILFTSGATCAAIRQDWSLAHSAESFDATLTECDAAIQQHSSSKSYDRVAGHFGSQHDTLTLADMRTVLATKSKNFFLLYSADLDSWVPSRSFVPEVQALGDVLTYRNFTDVGHDGYFTKREVFQDFLAP